MAVRDARSHRSAAMRDRHVTPSLFTALAYFDRGWSPLFVPLQSKNPQLSHWQKLRPTREQIATDFARPGNIGIRLGAPSGNLIDLDLDSGEAIALAPNFLTTTGAIFGRASKPGSHWLYIVDPPPKTMQFKDIGGTVLLELRSTGLQTIFPGSVHPCGQVIRWDREGTPNECAPPIVCSSVARLAAAALLVRHYPAKGSRHDFCLAIAGFLLRGGMTVEETEQFIRAIAYQARDPELRDRQSVVRTTSARLAKGEHATGATELSKLLGKPVVEKLRSWPWLRPGTGETVASYVAGPDGIVWQKPSRDGVAPIRLTNFTARILADLCHVNGIEEHREVELEASLDGRKSRFSVPARAFAAMKWPAEHLGPRAVLFPGLGLADHARAAIQLLSPEVVSRTIFEHTGWGSIGGRSVYLHAGGAIGDEGAVSDVEVDLPTSLARIVLPPPPVATELTAAVVASLRLLDVAPLRITASLLGAVYRSVLGDSDFSVHLCGPTGVFKTCLAAVTQAHFGSGFNERNLPGNWSSTGNSLEAVAFAAKDVLIVIDDFGPISSSYERAQQQRLAERIFRAQGNLSGRLRMNADTSLRPPKPPRGLILSTGEDSPAGASLRARMLTVGISPGDVNIAALTLAQQEAAGGQLARAIAGYVRWLAMRIETVQGELPRKREAYRNAFRSSSHRRTASIVADLCLGWHFFLEFCDEIKSCPDVYQMRQQLFHALFEVASAQSALQAESDPAARFLDLLSSAISSGRAHLSGTDGDLPPEPGACGWRREALGTWRAMGDRVGWISDLDLLLDPDASFKAAQDVARGGDELPISPYALRRRLRDAGILASTDEDRGKLTVRRTLNGLRREVLHLDPKQLGVAPDNSAQLAQN